MAFIHIVTIVLATAALRVSGLEWSELHVKYSMLFGGYWEMPLTVSAIESKTPPKFVKAGHDDELNVALYSYPNDPRFFLLYDYYGNIAGIRTGYIKSDIPKAAKEHDVKFTYDYSNISMFKSGTFWGTDIWYASVLFLHPDKLKAGGREDIKGKVAEGVYAKLDGKWIHVARNECEVEQQGFTKQACFVGMGQHYFYKVTPSSDCKNMQPFFALYTGGELQGFGLVPFGSFTYKDKKWFESVPRKAVEMILPNAPQCAYEWVDNFEVTSLHFFLKDHARWTMCSLFGSDNCKK